MKAKDKHGPVSDVLDILRINGGLDAKWIQEVLGRSSKQVEECLTLLAEEAWHVKRELFGIVSNGKTQGSKPLSWFSPS